MYHKNKYLELNSYLKQSQQGTYSQQAKERIVEDATKQMFTLNFNSKQPKDILTTNNVSKVRAIEYKTSMHNAVKPLFKLTEYELTIYARAIRDNSKEDFDTLQKISEIYKQAGDDILAIVSPQDVSTVHLDIINSLYKFSVVLSNLAKGYDDPAASLAGSGQFNAAEEGVEQAFNKLQTYFILKEIVNE